MKSAYAVHPGPGDDEGRIIIVREGEEGFRCVPDYDCSPKRNRPGIARCLNKRLGVTEKEATRLVVQSMFGGKAG